MTMQEYACIRKSFFAFTYTWIFSNRCINPGNNRKNLLHCPIARPCRLCYNAGAF